MKRHIYTLLTFYKFVNIQDPHTVVRDHLKFCKDIGLKGRIYIGEEGISATLTGNDGQIRAYRMYLDSIDIFSNIADIDIKATRVDDYYFDRMVVKYRREIVALGMTVTAEQVEQYRQEVSISELQDIITHRDPDRYIILDMRNSYEYKLGHFKYAVPSGTVNFREMMSLIDKYKELYMDKKVIMYCTGGIRCEKLAVLLHLNGLNNFYSLEGGIVKYINTYDDGHWLGNLYTFDGRVSTYVGSHDTHTTIGRCIYDDSLTDHISNCRYGPCNARIICKASNYRKYMGFCSKECYQSASQDLRIKNANRDKKDYQAMRDGISKNPNNKPAYIVSITNYLNSRLADLPRKHLTSQKEEYIDCEC